jgi:hypothetical protein
MRAFLASHPRISIPSVGSNMWMYFSGRFGDLGKPENLDACLDAMLTYKHIAFLDPDEPRVRADFAAGPPTYARLFAIFLEHYAEREGKPRWGVQSGLEEQYADEMIAAYPGLRIIHMLRDPRDRYQASIEKWPDGKGRAGGAAARWRYTTNHAERNLRRYPDQYLAVRFEDLIRFTEATMRTVCAFVGEDFDPQMLAMTGADKHRRLLAGDLPLPSGTSVLSPEFIGLHEDSVEASELLYLETVLERRMRRWGYETGPQRLRGGAWARWAVTEFPSQTARMLAWSAAETIHHHAPRAFPRIPGKRMIVERVGSDL